MHIGGEPGARGDCRRVCTPKRDRVITPLDCAPRLRCLTFDWGDTLAANVGMPYLATQRRAFAALGRELTTAGFDPGADFVERWMADLADDWHHSIDPERNPDHREFDFSARMDNWVTAVAGAESATPAVRAAVDRCHDRLCDTVLPLTEASPVLVNLHARGFRIGILSHVPWVGAACRRWFVRHHLAHAIDFYSLSSEVGWIKPHPAHFAHALAQAGCPGESILHVGDHPRRDIHGARVAGWNTCLRRTERVYPEAELDACAPDAEILHLAELLDLLPARAGDG